MERVSLTSFPEKQSQTARNAGEAREVEGEMETDRQTDGQVSGPEGGVSVWREDTGTHDTQSRGRGRPEPHPRGTRVLRRINPGSPHPMPPSENASHPVGTIGNSHRGRMGPMQRGVHAGFPPAALEAGTCGVRSSVCRRKPLPIRMVSP